MTCEFWKDGAVLPGVRADVLIADEQADIGIVAIPLTELTGYVPKTIPLAPKSRHLTMKEEICSMGHANGGWGTGWVGHVVGAQGQDILFLPPPAGGRSGSAIFDKDGKEILGVISARNNATMQGVAISTLTVYDVSQKRRDRRSV